MISPRIFAVLALGAWSAYAGSTTVPVPREDEWWKGRQAQLNQRVKDHASEAQVLFIGDSITQGWEGEGKEVWSRYYTGRHAINLGIGGDRTEHVLWRFDHGNLDGVHPKAAVVMIGTNNSGDNSPGEIVEGVTAIVNALRSKLPDTKVLLVGIFPRGEKFNDQRGRLLQVNQALHRLADNKSVFWADFGFKFIANDGSIPKDLMPDFLHLSPGAYQIWADSIEERLSKLIGDTRIEAKAAAAVSDVLSGDWVGTMNGPNGDPVSSPIVLKQEGTKITGKFARGQDRWLEIEEGKLEGNAFSWTVKRDRPNGEVMVYKMSGTIENGELKGSVKTTVDGQEVVTTWSGKRK